MVEECLRAGSLSLLVSSNMSTFGLAKLFHIFMFCTGICTTPAVSSCSRYLKITLLSTSLPFREDPTG